MSKVSLAQGKYEEFFESCLEHVDDFEDGPIWFGRAPAEIEKKTWWTKREKAAFVELLGRKGSLQLDKIGQIINKSPAECQMYLRLLQTAVQNEPNLPTLTYMDIPAAIESNDDEEEEGGMNGNGIEEFSKAMPEPGSLLNYSALMKRFNCVLTAEAAQNIEEAVIERLKSIIYYCQFCQSGPADVNYMLDQYFEVYPDPILENCDQIEAQLSSEDLDEEFQIELEKQETELLEKYDHDGHCQLQSSSELRTYMNLNE